MCLAIPGKIIDMTDEKAIVDFCGIKREVNISLLPDVQKEEYVLVHVGFAIQKIDTQRAQESYGVLCSQGG